VTNIKKVINISKIVNDKYYTSPELAKYCIDKTKEIIGEQNITEYLEPSAGNGVFLDFLPIETLSYDIEPENDKIIKQDYLSLDLNYKKGRCVIGNPPYGGLRNDLVYKFYKKSIEIANYISFILPISKLNNTSMMYQFDLIYSENLGDRLFSGRNIRCCFNIYQKPISDKLNKKIIIKLNDLEIIRQDQKSYPDILEYDLRMAHWGNGCVGKILKENEHYSNEYKIIIHNEKLKNKIIKVLTSINWKQKLNCVSMLRIYKKDIYNLLKEQIPEIE
jgi:hypothetical protein